MEWMRIKRRGICCDAGLTLMASAALMLAGCGDRSVSGTYVSHNANDTGLLQVTETPDHHLTGTLRHASMNNDGTLASSAENVTGAVDGNSITLTVLATPFPVGQNFSGTVSSEGIDLTVSLGANTAIQHFAKGNVSAYEAIVSQISQAGARIIASRQREQQVNQLDHEVDALMQDLNAFLVRAHELVERTPRVIVYYAKTVSAEQEKLNRALQLIASGNSLSQGQASVIIGQMSVDKAQISNADEAIARTQAEVTAREGALNVGIARWNDTCLDGTGVKPGDVIPNMGPCKGLSRAVAAYHAVLPSLHTAVASAVQAKAHGDEQLATIWRAAGNIH